MCRTDILPYLPNCNGQNASNAMLRHDMTKRACLSGCALSNLPSWLLSFCMFWQGEPGSDGTKGEKVSSVSFLCLRLNSFLFAQVLQHQNVSNLINVVYFFHDWHLVWPGQRTKWVCSDYSFKAVCDPLWTSLLRLCALGRVVFCVPHSRRVF